MATPEPQPPMILHPVELDTIRKKAQAIVDDTTHGLDSRALCAVVVSVSGSHEEVRKRTVGLIHATDALLAALRAHDPRDPAIPRALAAIRKAEEVMCA